jgi:hypothetical protein
MVLVILEELDIFRTGMFLGSWKVTIILLMNLVNLCR